MISLDFVRADEQYCLTIKNLLTQTVVRIVAKSLEELGDKNFHLIAFRRKDIILQASME